jgi:hypothetical protein
MTNFSPPPGGSRVKAITVPAGFSGFFCSRGAGFRHLHRNAAQGCTAAFDPVQEIAGAPDSHARAALVIWFAPDDRLESERQAHRGA